MVFEILSKETGKHYLYQHIRLDTNEVFYIGVGTKYNHHKDYTRAKAKGKQRNRIWRGIVKRVNYKVEVIEENDNYELIKNKEIELISKYGQIIKETGTLCNLTNGGDGILGVEMVDLWKPTYIYTKDGVYYKGFKNINVCANYLNCAKSTITLSYNKDHLIKGYIIKDFKKDNVPPILDIKEKLKKRLSKKVYQYDVDLNLIKEWESSSEASRILGISGGHIREVASGKTNRKKSGGFIWKYEKL